MVLKYVLDLVVVILYITSNGSLVEINVTNTGVLPLVNISLPIEPLGFIYVTNSSGAQLPAVKAGDELIIPAAPNETVLVRYTPNVESMNNGLLGIKVSSAYPVKLYVSPSILPDVPSGVITNFSESGNYMVLDLLPGNYTVSFLVVQQAPQAPQAITEGQRGISPQLIIIVISIAVAIALIILTVLLVTRRRGGFNLSGVDSMVINALIEMGGEAFQSDIQRKLGLPRTTVWRSIRRLEARGYVIVDKYGKMNRVRLVRKP